MSVMPALSCISYIGLTQDVFNEETPPSQRASAERNQYRRAVMSHFDLDAPSRNAYEILGVVIIQTFGVKARYCICDLTSPIKSARLNLFIGVKGMERDF